jgi:hypothetical protein
MKAAGWGLISSRLAFCWISHCGLFFYRESNWDLFGLLIVSSFAALLYQAMHKALPPRFLRGVILLGAGSALVAILIVLILARSGWGG